MLRNDGLYRHLRFARPGTICMHFDILTWPGHLCYTGDMGTYVFQRRADMLQFFRRGESRRDREPRDAIDLRYWAEKLQAHDSQDPAFAFSDEQFREDVRDYVDQATSDDEDWPAERRAALTAAIDEDLLDGVEDEHSAWCALRDFAFSDEHGQFQFIDWERNCKRPTHRFQWCCLALDWAIGVFDAQDAEAQA